MFEPEYRERINRIIKVIIRNPGGEWTTESLADIAGISAFHFHRIFRALTGETMFSFLQRRRLIYAVELIQEGDFTLTEVALECGFDSGSSLSRAFRKYLHCSPTQFRKQPCVPLLPQTRTHSLARTAAKVEICKMHSQTAIVVERKGLIDQNFNQAATDAFRLLVEEIKRVNCRSALGESIGMCPDEANLVPDAEARYQAGFLYKGELPEMNEEVRRVKIPGGKWAVSIHQGSYETLWQHWNWLYRDWLPSSGKSLRNTAPFEIYLNNKKQVPPEELRTEIRIPIQ